MTSTLGTVSIGGTIYALGREPDSCPHCKYACTPEQLNWCDNGARFASDYMADVAYQCPRHGCRRMFIARYSAPEFRVQDVDREKTLRLMEVIPRPIRSTSFPAEIARVSPRFVEIFAQAEQSEVLGLVDVAGPGYRKALEHLIKDYACLNAPEESARIKKLALAQCIKNYVPDPRVSQCAERAVWLGNDETHYERTWIEKDLRDLEVLIKLTVYWIDSEALTHGFVESMPAKT